MSLITDQSTIFSLTNLVSYAGQYSGSFGNQDFMGSIPEPFTSMGGYNSTTILITGFNIYYKMEGYNTITQQYENWHSMGSPLLIPPSGHTLSNISVVATWTDR